MAGLLSGSDLILLVQHRGIFREALWDVLETRFPEAIITTPGVIEPSSAMSVEVAAALARRRRGIEPMRIVILPQWVASVREDWAEPMPIVF